MAPIISLSPANTYAPPKRTAFRQLEKTAGASGQPEFERLFPLPPEPTPRQAKAAAYLNRIGSKSYVPLLRVLLGHYSSFAVSVRRREPDRARFYCNEIRQLSDSLREHLRVERQVLEQREGLRPGDAELDAIVGTQHHFGTSTMGPLLYATLILRSPPRLARRLLSTFESMTEGPMRLYKIWLDIKHLPHTADELLEADGRFSGVG